MTALALREGWPDLPETADAWLGALGGPIALRVAGRDRSRLRVVSGLLHGNEPSGLRAIFHVLRRREPFATDVLFFLGAVEAARRAPGLAYRMLPDRRDLNRCFCAPFDGVDGAIAEAALSFMRADGLEAVIDLHNNTGHNPAYGVGSAASPARLGLVSFFARRFVCSAFGLGSLHEAFADGVPAVTIECGRAGDPDADARAAAGLVRLLATDRLPAGDRADFEVLDDPARIYLRPGVTLRFGDHRESDADLTMALDVDRHNFQRLQAGTRVGWVRAPSMPVQARNQAHEDVTDRFFEIRRGELVTREALIPIMITTNVAVAAIDCLFYVVREAR